MEFEVVEPRAIEQLETNAIDETYPDWVSGAVVAAGEYRIYNDYIYLCTEDTTTADTELPNVSAKWYPQQPVNSKAMLTAYNQIMSEHGETTAVCSCVGDLHVIFSCNKCNMLAIMGVLGASVQVIERNDTGDIIADTTYDIIDDGGPDNLYDWFLYDVPSDIRANIAHPLTIDFSQKVEIIIHTPDTATAELAFIVAGRTEGIGCTQFGASVTQVNPRQPEKNAFGKVQLVKGDLANLISCDIKLASDSFDAAKKKLDSLSNKATMFRLMDGVEAFLQFGYYTSMVQVYENASMSQCSLDIESFIQQN